MPCATIKVVVKGCMVIGYGVGLALILMTLFWDITKMNNKMSIYDRKIIDSKRFNFKTDKRNKNSTPK